MTLKDKWALDDEYRSTPKFQDQKHKIGNNNNNTILYYVNVINSK